MLARSGWSVGHAGVIENGRAIPERVRLIDAEVGARIPVVKAVARNVVQPVGDYDGPQGAVDDADDKDLVGIYLQHFTPNLFQGGGLGGVSPLFVELQQAPGCG